MKRIEIGVAMLVVMARAAAADLPVVPAPLEQPPPAPGLVITSVTVTVIFKSNMVYYTNQVMAEYPPSKPGDAPAILHADEATGWWAKGGKITNIVAHGHVRMDHGDEHALGQHAVYTTADERVVLTGVYPGSTNKQPVIYSPKGTNYADTNIYDRLQDKLFGDGNVRTYPNLNATNSSPATNAPAARPLGQQTSPAPAPAPPPVIAPAKPASTTTASAPEAPAETAPDPVTEKPRLRIQPGRRN